VSASVGNLSCRPLWRRHHRTGRRHTSVSSDTEAAEPLRRRRCHAGPHHAFSAWSDAARTIRFPDTGGLSRCPWHVRWRARPSLLPRYRRVRIILQVVPSSTAGHVLYTPSFSARWSEATPPRMNAGFGTGNTPQAVSHTPTRATPQPPSLVLNPNLMVRRFVRSLPGPCSPTRRGRVRDQEQRVGLHSSMPSAGRVRESSTLRTRRAQREVCSSSRQSLAAMRSRTLAS